MISGVITVLKWTLEEDQAADVSSLEGELRDSKENLGVGKWRGTLGLHENLAEWKRGKEIS